MYREPIFQCSVLMHVKMLSCAQNDETTNESIDLPENFNESFFRNVSLFYLKSQVQLLLPASKLQVIVEEMHNEHDSEHDSTLNKLYSLSKHDTSLTDDAFAKICDCVNESDHFLSVIGDGWEQCFQECRHLRCSNTSRQESAAKE